MSTQTKEIDMSDTKENKTQTKSRAAKLKKVVIALVAVAVTGSSVWYFLIRKPTDPKNVIKVSGRIEGDDATVSTKIAGRIREIQVREGDQVKVGQVIATIDDDQVNAREEQEESKVQQAEARVLPASVPAVCWTSRGSSPCASP